MRAGGEESETVRPRSSDAARAATFARGSGEAQQDKHSPTSNGMNREFRFTVALLAVVTDA